MSLKNYHNFYLATTKVTWWEEFYLDTIRTLDHINNQQVLVAGERDFYSYLVISLMGKL